MTVELLLLGSLWFTVMSGLGRCEIRERSRLSKALMVAAGTVCLALGSIGVFVPVLPTTPFLLLAAACYARGSRRFYCWLLSNRILGTYLRYYYEGRGLPLRVRALTITILWLTIGITTISFLDELWLRVALLLVAIAVSVHVATLGPKGPSRA